MTNRIIHVLLGGRWTYPFKSGGLGGGAVAVTVGHVGHHGTDVVRPGSVPVRGDGGTGGDAGRELGAHGRTGVVAREVGVGGARDGAVDEK